MAIPNALWNSYQAKLQGLNGHEAELLKDELIAQFSEGISFATALSNAGVNVNSKKRVIST